jgi:TolB-like protein/Tfp pilus assembly protein PilF
VLLLTALGWWILHDDESAEYRGKINSIAVLPLENLSGDPSQDDLADGMTYTLINDLSRIGTVKVIARSSSMRYKGTTTPLEEIARALDVDALLEGSVQREGDRVRITIQLIEAATNRNLWANRYDRNLKSILVMQGEVALTIARDLQLTLTPEEKDFLTRYREIDPKAYEAYLRGLAHISRVTLADLETGRQYFKEALEIEPEYAPAQAGIATTWAGSLFVGAAPPREIIPKWREAALRAVEMDNQLSEVHREMAAFETWGDWDWKSAETSFRRTIELNPNDSLARSLYSHYLLIMKRPDEAIAQAEKAVELDPFNPFVLSYYGIVLQYGTRQFDAAIDQFQKVLRITPHHHVGKKLYRVYLAKGMQEEAFNSLTAATRDPEEIMILKHDYAKGGFTEVMSGMAERTSVASSKTYIPAHFVAIYHSLARNNQLALNWLERAIEERDPNVTYMGVIFAHRNLHNDPRFRELLRKLNFPDDVLRRYLEE